MIAAGKESLYLKEKTSFSPKKKKNEAEGGAVVSSPSATRKPEPVAAAPRPATAAVPAPVSRALYDFTGANEGELTCKAGDALTVKSENGDWVLCVLAEGGKLGWIPKSYVLIAKTRTPFDDDNE